MELASALPATKREEAERAATALHDGRLDAALAAFRSLALDLPENAVIASNLAALYLDRAARPDGSPHNLILALDAAERAVNLAPRSALAHFNRAEALTRLHLPISATAAWNRYLALDGDSPRVFRAQAAMMSLRTSSAYNRWQATGRARFEVAALAGNDAELDVLVRRYPFFARLHAEETLLPAWSGALSHERLAALKLIGEVFAERLHDFMVADTVSEVERATEPRRSEIARGIVAFGDGMARYREGRDDPANALRQAVRSGCPLGAWARLYDLVALLHRDARGAEAAFAKMEVDIDPGRYPVLAGRIRWLRGTAALNLDRPERAIEHYRVAFDRLFGSEGPQSAGYVHLLLGEAYGRIGEREEEWHERLQSLPAVHQTGELRAIHATLYDSIESLLAEGRPWAALGFSRELGAVAARRIRPTARIEPALQRGRILDRLGDREGALAAFRSAEAHLPDLGSPELREKISATLEMAEGQALAATDPEAAVARLTSALGRQRGSAYRYHEAALLAARAEVLHTLGRISEAESDLAASLTELEVRRTETREPVLRQVSFEVAQAAFDRMIRLQAEDLGNTEQAFAFAERSRGRLLLDQAAGAASNPAPLASATELRANLPSGAVLVEYAVLPDRLYVWTFDGRLDLHIESVTARELERLVDQLVLEIEIGRVSRSKPGVAASLYDRLIRPIAGKLPAGADLVLVPDRALSRVPFAALVDAGRGRFLVEDRALAVQPSATLYVAAVHRARQLLWRNEVGTSLAVGDPAFDRGVYPGLPRLPNAAAEAREVAALRANATLLLGGAASREAFLAAAPQAAMIHYAGHALRGTLSPSGSRLLLRPTRAGEPGTVTAVEIAALHLSKTGLVVLSACRGVTGEDAGRENLAGLAASFLAAGVPTVVASLWNSSDATTRVFMNKYHRALVAGRPPAHALREVQLALLSGGDGKLAAPATWAGFAVFGSETASRPAD